MAVPTNIRIIAVIQAAIWWLSGIDSAMAQFADAPVTTVGQPAESVATGPMLAPAIQVASDDNLLPSRLQGRIPSELFLPPPSAAAVDKANRFVEATINPELPLELVLGRPKILQFAEAPLRVYLPDEQIITTDVLDTTNGRQLALTGRAVGATTLTFWFRDQNDPSGEAVVSYLVRVHADPTIKRTLDEFQQQLSQTFPNSFIELEELGGQLVLRGQARDTVELSRILMIVARARGARPVSQRSTQVARIGDINAVSFTSPSEQVNVADETAALDPTALAAAGIVNLMTIPGEQQVMLRVTVAEVNRTAARSVGLNFNAIKDNARFSNTTGNITGNILAVLDGGDVSLRIEALRKLSLSRTLAEPNLVALNGQPANFQAGGKFPIPVIAGGALANNLQGVQFVPFGVQLQFIPQIQDRDVVRLQVRADVSTRDESLGANIGGGTAVPGLNSRNFSTTVELQSGQTLAVAGLLQTNFGASSDRVPFWGDLPLIGFTGGVNRTSAAEQELVILVTPELVAPVDACCAPKLPGQDIHEPTDIEFFIANRLESRRSRDYRSAVRTDYPRMRMPDKCCADRYLVGGVGPTDRCCNQPANVAHRPINKQPNAATPVVDGEMIYEDVAP